MNSKPIIVGIAGLQPAAIRFAVEEATAHQCLIRVVHCVEPLLSGDLPVEYTLSDDEARHTAGQKLLDEARKFVEDMQPDQLASYGLLLGSPAGVLEREASNAAMMVVGTDSASWADRIVGGRVAAHLAKRSPALLAVVPEQSSPSQPKPAGGVFVALETGTLATSVLRFAFDEAAHRGTELTVIHAVSDRADDHEVNEERRRMAIQLSGWADRFPDVRVSSRIVFDGADDGCLHASDEAEVLILGRSAGPRVNMPWSHPVLAQIARRAHCPCIVVPSTRNEDQDLAPHEFGGYRHMAPF